MSELPSFLRQNNIPLYRYTHCISIHSWLDILLASTFWLLWMTLLWTCMYKYLLESMLWILLNMCPGVELLDHMATMFFSFLRNLHTVFQQHATFLNWPVPLSIFPLRFNNNLFFFLLSYSPSSQCATACLDICH